MKAREIAVKVLERVLYQGAYSNIVLNKFLEESDLSQKDRGLTTELVYGTLRRKKSIDMIISSFVKDISLMDKNTLNIIRLAIYQMRYLDKVPSYAACNEAVEIAKQVSEQDSKLVNGILRNFASKDGTYDIEFRNKIDQIAYEFSFEPWLIRMFIKQYGEKQTIDILKGLNYTPELTVRVNNLKDNYEDVYEKLEELGYTIEDGSVCPEAIYIDSGSSITKNELFAEGKITVQDESAMLIAPLLDLEDGQTVVDLCCAPGGKTTHIAELLNNTGDVKAYDLNESKLELVKENCDRLGITNVTLAQMDATKINAELISAADRVLIDVPCSGLGIIRKKPEIKWNKTRKDLKELVLVQREIMKNAWEYLKKDGIMVYSTCTLNKEENEENISWFIENNKDAEVQSIFIGKGSNLKYDKMGTLTILPDEYMDGFFIAKLKKH